MRLLCCWIWLVVLAASTAHADAILFATAATTNGVDGFCLHPDGSLEPTPRIHRPTKSTNPRRLVVGSNGALYVVQSDLVEAFRIGPHGGLKSLGTTRRLTKPNKMSPFDVALSRDQKMLYVPQNGQRRIAAYPLATDGTPEEDFSSCVQGPVGPRYQRIKVRDDLGLLYVTEAANNGNVSVFPLTRDPTTDRLELQLKPADCHLGKTPSDPTCPLSQRRKVPTPGAFILDPDRDRIYVESLFRHRIFDFQLTNGHFTPPTRKKTGEVVSVCLTDADGNALKGPFKWQPAASRTHPVQRYQDVVRWPADESPEQGTMQTLTLLGSQFLRGRIDAFHLNSDGSLPREPSISTKADVRGSPVGLAVRGNVLYVAAGELDRVQAFRLGAEKALPEQIPFSETNEQKDSFPNALAVAELTSDCTGEP